MRFIPRQLLALGWNEKVLTLDDFENCCAREGVWVYSIALRRDEGMFFYFRERPVIVLNRDLLPAMTLWAAWHELAHFFLHPPALQYFARGTEDKADAEANIIAAVALLPTRLLETKTLEDIQEEYSYPDELLCLRKRVYEQFKM